MRLRQGAVVLAAVIGALLGAPQVRSEPPLDGYAFRNERRRRHNH
jgi:hypothetical protein